MHNINEYLILSTLQIHQVYVDANDRNINDIFFCVFVLSLRAWMTTGRMEVRLVDSEWSQIWCTAVN